jgi:hypothetical protein
MRCYRYAVGMDGAPAYAAHRRGLLY